MVGWGMFQPLGRSFSPSPGVGVGGVGWDVMDVTAGWLRGSSIPAQN